MPTAPERIVALAEKEQDIRERTNNLVIKTKAKDSILGQVLAFLSVIACLIVAYLCADKGHDAVAGAIITSATILASIFALKTYPKKISKE